MTSLDHFKQIGYDSAFYLPHIKTLSVNFISTNNVKQAFVKAGFKSWKKALKTERGFPFHDGCDARGVALESFLKKGTDETTDVKISSKPSTSNFNKEIINENCP